MSEDEQVKLYPSCKLFPRAINETEMAELINMCDTKAFKLFLEIYELRAEKHSKTALELNQDPCIRDQAIVRYNTAMGVLNFPNSLKEEKEKGAVVES